MFHSLIVVCSRLEFGRMRKMYCMIERDVSWTRCWSVWCVFDMV
jgi:hypothetical protein